jgi:PAS domain-containing protein
LTANASALAFLGLKEDEVISRSLIDFFQRANQNKARGWLKASAEKTIIVAGSIIRISGSNRVVSVWLKRKPLAEKSILIWIISLIDNLTLDLTVENGIVILYLIIR